LAKTDIGPRISVEGESEYRKQMQNIIQQQKEYSSELNLVTAQLGKNATAQQKASSIASVLKKQIQNQESALSAQNTMLQKAVTKWGDASKEASGFRTAINKTSAELATLKSRLSDAENGLGEFSDQTKTAGDDLAASVTAGTLAAKAYATIGSELLSAGKKVVEAGVSYNAQLEQYQTALTNMLGSASDAENALEQIKQDAARTPFDTAGLVKANELLISTGVDADSSRKVILALGDAVSATGGGNEELSRMAQNLQQIKNAGKATAADIKQFAYAGIDVYGILADYTGKSTAEVQKMTVTYDVLTAALEKASDEGGRYYNSMSTQSETLNGRMSTLTDNATQLAGLMTADLTDGIKMVVGNLNDMTVAATEAYKTDGWVGLAKEIASLNPLISGVISEMSALGDGLSTIAQNAISVLDQWSYKLNKALGKDAYAGYDSYEDYRSQTDSQKNKNRRRQEALAGKGISNQKQYDRLHPTVKPPTSSGSNTPTGSTTQKNKKAAADQKKLAKSVTETNTQLLEGTGNIVGAIKQVTETADNTYNVYDGTTKQLKGTTQETAQTVTRTWTEMVNGVQKNYKQVVKLINGVEKSSETTSESVNQTLSSSSTNTEKISGVEGVEGTLNRTTQTTQEIQKVWNESTGQMEDKVVSTGRVVTDTFNRVKDGALEAVTQIKTFDEAGNLLSTKEQTANVERSNTSTSTKTQKIYGQEGVQGALERTTQTTKELQKVWNEELGQYEDKMVETGKTVTDSFIRMNNGIAEAVTLTTTYIGDQVVDTQEHIEPLKEEIIGVQGTVGSFSQFILDLDTKLGGLEQAASNLSKSPLGSWFSDLAKGYRASDSFFDNIDVPGLIVGGLVSAATGYMKGGIPGAIASAGLSIVGNLIGTNLSGLANESNNWGADLVTGMANGMKEAGGFLATAAKGLAETVKSFLHFSRPDVGPLREYEQWMPDMVKGMAKGITDNAYMLRDAVRGLSGQMETQLTYDVGRASSALTTAYNTRRISMGGVSISIYPQEGQDAEEIAQYTIDKLQMMINSEASANGEIPVF
jgi:tape measure domain-containing protein